MNLHPQDILIRKTDGTETLWLSQRLVMEVCGISEGYFEKRVRTSYKKSVRACDLAKSKEFLPDSGKAWRWAKTSQGFYYCLDNIPNKAPKYYRSMFGDAETLRELWESTLKNKAATELEMRFKRHLKANFRHFIEHYTDANEVQRPALAKACAVLDFILEEKDSYPGTKNKLYKDLSPIIKEMDLQYIPHNPLRLKEKIDILETTDHAIPEIIRLPRQGNDNAEQYKDPVVIGWAMNLRANGANFTDMHIIRQIWEACERTGRRKPSARWFGQEIFEQARTQFLTAQKRYGSSKRANIHKSYIPFADAFYAGDCWEVDATRVNIIPHETKDENGKKIESSLMVVAVRDVMSGDILGYDFTHAENHASFARAMKMAVQTAGYLPYELVTDRFPGHNTDQIKRLFERLEALGLNAIEGDFEDLFLVIPKIGSQVLCATIEDDNEETAIIKYTEIDKVVITIGGARFEMSGGQFQIKNENADLKKINNELLDALKNAKILTPSGVGRFAEPTKLKFNQIKEKNNELFK